MFYSTLLAATAFTAAVSAQNYSTSGTNLTIDPNSVDYNTRQSWCRAQINSCPKICGGQASPNTCNPNDLTFGCTCTNGNSPNITAYDQTIPAFVCQQWISSCVDAHPDDLDGITACRSVECGDKNASMADSTSSSMPSMTATSSGSQTSSTSGSSSGGSSTSDTDSDSDSDSSDSDSPTNSAAAESASATGAASALNVASNYGTGVLAAGILAAFGLAL